MAGSREEGMMAQGDGRGSIRDDDTLEILPSDHPLMKRFQESLRDHLQRQRHQLAEEVFKLEAEWREQEGDRARLGERLYDAQQEVHQQLRLLDTCHTSLVSIMEARVLSEDAVTSCKGTHRTQADKLAEAETREEELRSELQGLVLLLDQLSRWEQQLESDLCVSQRVTEKTTKDKLLLASEKRKQDEVILRLMGELWRLRDRGKRLDVHLALREAEGAELGQLVADGSADLGALQQEQRRLVQTWGHVVASLQHRDRALQATQLQLTKLQEDISNLNCEIESYKKSSESEMVNNEKVTLLLYRHETEVREWQRLLVVEGSKKSRSEAQLCSYADVLTATEESLQESAGEQQLLGREDRTLQQQLDRLVTEQVRLQDDLLERLREQGGHDNTAHHVNHLVVQLREKNRAQERDMVHAENELSKLSLAAEQQKVLNKSRQQLLADLRREVSTQEQSVRQLEKELGAAHVAVTKKQSAIHALNKRLDTLAYKTGTADQSPNELQIADLNQRIAEAVSSVGKLQQLWLRQQAHIVQLSHKAAEHFQNTDMLRKQVVVKEQSNLRLEREAASLEQEERDLGRSIHMLLHRLTCLNTHLSERRGYKDTLDRDNTFTSGQYLGYLKECERAHAELLGDVAELRQEQQRLSQELLGLRCESLAWDKKLQLAVQTKQSLAQEHASLGDMATMKCEIHRMEVRYSQLRKVQERLAQDLQHCVSRRTAIVCVAQVREKRALRGAYATRASLHSKLDDLSSKIRHALAELRSREKEAGAVERRQQELLQHLTEEQQRLEVLQQQATQLEQQLHDGWLAKQQNLDLLVRRQRKLRMLEDVRHGRHKLLFRSETALTAEHQRQSSLRGHLLSILESLLADFPSLSMQFTHVLDYLRL